MHLQPRKVCKILSLAQRAMQEVKLDNHKLTKRTVCVACPRLPCTLHVMLSRLSRCKVAAAEDALVCQYCRRKH